MFELVIKTLKDISIFVGYIKTNTYPLPLTLEKEEYYLTLFKNNNDTNAREILIKHNLRLVIHIVKKYQGDNEKEDDLFSIGVIGLIKAIDSYSFNKKVKLATYAAKCIDNEILMHLRANKKNYQIISLNDGISIDKDGTELSLQEVIPYDEEPILDQIVKNDNIKNLKEYINILDEKEKEIINLRYGLNGKEYTQKEIAKKFKISRSYVSRIEKRALIKLLNKFKATY